MSCLLCLWIIYSKKYIYIYPQKKKYRYSKKIELIKEAINYIREIRYFVLEIPKNISSTLKRALEEVIWKIDSGSALVSVLEIFLGILSTKQMVSLKYLITYRCLSKWVSDIQVLNCLERMSRVRFKIFGVEKVKWKSVTI